MSALPTTVNTLTASYASAVDVEPIEDFLDEVRQARKENPAPDAHMEAHLPIPAVEVIIKRTPLIDADTSNAFHDDLHLLNGALENKYVELDDGMADDDLVTDDMPITLAEALIADIVAD